MDGTQNVKVGFLCIPFFARYANQTHSIYAFAQKPQQATDVVLCGYHRPSFSAYRCQETLFAASAKPEMKVVLVCWASRQGSDIVCVCVKWVLWFDYRDRLGAKASLD